MGATSSNNSRKRGTALIISHYLFTERNRTRPVQEHLENREGTQTDHEQLRKTLSEDYNLKVELYTDYESSDKLTTKHIKSEIKSYDNKDYGPGETDCLVVFVMSHGMNGGVICSYDEHYYISDVYDPFVTSEAFKGKPKIFIFQACRGNSREPIVRRCGSQLQTSNDPAFQFLSVPNDPDTFIAYSTVENYTSMRILSKGTWFIESIISNLNTLQEPEELHEFITRVISEVVTRRGKILRDPLNQTESNTEERRESAMNISNDASCEIPGENNNSNVQENKRDITNNNTEIQIQETETYGQTPCFTSMMKNEMLISKQKQTVLIEPNAKANIIPLEKSFYVREKCQRGLALLFHTKPYRYSAQHMEQYLHYLQFDTKKIDLESEGFKRHLKEEQMVDKLKQTPSYLIVAIFAPVEYVKCGNLEECFIDVGKVSYPIRSILEGHFLASKCNMLLNKPKLFFIIDAKYQLQTSFFVASGDDIITHYFKDQKMNIPEVTEHSDMLFIHGSGQEFILNLCKQLRIGANEEDRHVFNTLQEAMKHSTPLDDHTRLTEEPSRISIKREEPSSSNSDDIFSNNAKVNKPILYFESTLKNLLKLTRDKELIQVPCATDVEKRHQLLYQLSKKIEMSINQCIRNKLKLQRYTNLDNKQKLLIEENEEVIEDAKNRRKEINELIKSINKLKIYKKRILIQNVPKYNSEGSLNIEIYNLIKNITKLKKFQRSDIKKIVLQKRLKQKMTQSNRQKSKEDLKDIEKSPTESISSTSSTSVQTPLETSIATTSYHNLNQDCLNADMEQISREQNGENTLRSMIVTLKTVKLRNRILKLSKKHKLPRNENNTEIRILPYIEHYTYELYLYAKKCLKKSFYQYVWYTKNGKVCVQKCDGHKILHIHSKPHVDVIVKCCKS